MEVRVPRRSTGSAATPSRYSEETLRRIKHARATRDTVLFLGGMAFVSYGVIAGDAIWRSGIVVAIIFGVSALYRSRRKPAWTRNWSRPLRYVCSIAFLIAGLYLMLYAVVSSGEVGMQGRGGFELCRPVTTVGRGGSVSVESSCAVNVRWSDGTTTLEQFESDSPVREGAGTPYVRPPIRIPFLTGDQPVKSTPNWLFDGLVGLAVVLQAAFSLGVLICGTTPPQKPTATRDGDS
jgi:hypothetical protein